MDCSLSGSSGPGILQARILEWVAISFSTSPDLKNALVKPFEELGVFLRTHQKFSLLGPAINLAAPQRPHFGFFGLLHLAHNLAFGNIP